MSKSSGGIALIALAAIAFIAFKDKIPALAGITGGGSAGASSGYGSSAYPVKSDVSYADRYLTASPANIYSSAVPYQGQAVTSQQLNTVYQIAQSQTPANTPVGFMGYVPGQTLADIANQNNAVVQSRNFADTAVYLRGLLGYI